MRKLRKGDQIYWYGSGSFKHTIFTGKVIVPNQFKDKYGFASRVRGDKGQGLIVDENWIYNRDLRLR